MSEFESEPLKSKAELQPFVDSAVAPVVREKLMYKNEHGDAVCEGLLLHLVLPHSIQLPHGILPRDVATQFRHLLQNVGLLHLSRATPSKQTPYKPNTISSSHTGRFFTTLPLHVHAHGSRPPGSVRASSKATSDYRNVGPSRQPNGNTNVPRWEMQGYPSFYEAFRQSNTLSSHGVGCIPYICLTSNNK